MPNITENHLWGLFLVLVTTIIITIVSWIGYNYDKAIYVDILIDGRKCIQLEKPYGGTSKGIYCPYYQSLDDGR